MMVAEDEALHRAQRSFRAVLDAFARPGEVRRIELAPSCGAQPAGLDAGTMGLASLFVDQATSLCVVDAAPDALARYIASRSHVHIVPLEEAAFLLVPARADEDFETRAVTQARCGTPASPEKGATVIIGCAKVAPVACDAGAQGDGADGVSFEGADEEGGALGGHAGGPIIAAETPSDPAGLAVFEVRGPGVAGVNRFAADRRTWAQARACRGDEFPCGIEIVLVDATGNVVAIPRTSAVSLRKRVS